MVRGFRALAALAVCALLAGCSGGSMADLHVFVDGVLAKKGTGVEPLPPVELPEVYTYQCTTADCVDPFEPFFQADPDPPKKNLQTGANSGLQPNQDRNKEELEQLPLDSLRMMGTLERGADIWGIVRGADGVIHRVQVGNYMGKNHGKIIAVMEERIELTEIIPDGQGGWAEREASLALIE